MSSRIVSSSVWVLKSAAAVSGGLLVWGGLVSVVLPTAIKIVVMGAAPIFPVSVEPVFHGL